MSFEAFSEKFNFIVFVERLGLGASGVATIVFLLTMMPGVEGIATSDDPVDVGYRAPALLIARLHWSCIPIFFLGLVVAAVSDQRKRALGRQYHGETSTSAEEQRASELRAARLARGDSGVPRPQGLTVSDHVAQLAQVKKPLLVAALVSLALGLVGFAVHRSHAKIDAIIKTSYASGEPRASVAAALKRNGYDVAPNDVQALFHPYGEAADVYVTVRSPRAGIAHQFKEEARTVFVSGAGLTPGTYKEVWPVSALPSVLSWLAMIAGFGAAGVLGLLAFKP